ADEVHLDGELSELSVEVWFGGEASWAKGEAKADGRSLALLPAIIGTDEHDQNNGKDRRDRDDDAEDGPVASLHARSILRRRAARVMGPEYTVPMRRLLLCVLAAVFAGACHGGGGGGAISSPTPSYSPSPTPTVPAGCVQVEGVSSAVVVATATSADEFALDLPAYTASATSWG